jgi:hypothetical protein
VIPSLGKRSLIIKRIVRKGEFRFSELPLMGAYSQSEAGVVRHCAMHTT